MATNPKYNTSDSYNKHLDCDFKSVSPCPPGLVAIFNYDGEQVACLSPNDAEVYKNSTLDIAEGYAKVYHPETGEYLGAMCASEACELLACISTPITDTNDIDYINAAVLAGSTLNLTGIGNAGASVDLSPLTGYGLKHYITGNAFTAIAVVDTYQKLATDTTFTVTEDGLYEVQSLMNVFAADANYMSARITINGAATDVNTVARYQNDTGGGLTCSVDVFDTNINCVIGDVLEVEILASNTSTSFFHPIRYNFKVAKIG
jgi:hypothetical protein